MDPLVREWLEIVGGGLLVFTLPIIIAFSRQHPQRWRIALLTVALGATVIGWIIALVWSLRRIDHPREPEAMTQDATARSPIARTRTPR